MMRLPYVNWDNFRFLTGLGKASASAVNTIMADLDRSNGEGLSGLMRAKDIRHKDRSVNIGLPPGSLTVRHKDGQWSYRYDALDLALPAVSSDVGDTSPFTITIAVYDGESATALSLPLAEILRTAPDVSDSHQVYRHGFAARDQSTKPGCDIGEYIGVTKRGWSMRWQEHQRAAERGSRYRFHQAIRGWFGVAGTTCHQVLVCGLSEAKAMAFEEYIVGRETLYPKGLNMIPGGYAGLKYLRQIGAAGANERVSADDKQDIVNRFFETASRKGLPNPLAAANWCDPSYAEKVICAADNRLKPDQIRNARFLASLGKSTDDIITEIGALNKPQVQRLLSGSTYSRVA